MATQNDKKTELTFSTIEKLRASNSLYNEVIKSASNYQKQLQKLAEAGRAFSDALQKVSQHQGGDLGDGINKVVELQRLVDTKTESVSKSFLEDLVNNLQRNQKPEETEVNQFESDYKKTRSNMRTQISKLEASTKKAGKKGAEALQQSITELNDKIKEAEQVKADKLRQILLIERKKYCTLLGNLSSVLASESDFFNDSLNKVKEIDTTIKTLAASQSQLPNESEEMISAQQRTFVALQSSDDASYSSGYNDYSSYDDSSANYDTSGNDYSYGGGYSTATALYDYAGETADDLPFYAGDVISIIHEDDGSGWLTGELNGRRGMFPSSYVSR